MTNIRPWYTGSADSRDDIIQTTYHCYKKFEFHAKVKNLEVTSHIVRRSENNFNVLIELHLLRRCSITAERARLFLRKWIIKVSNAGSLSMSLRNVTYPAFPCQKAWETLWKWEDKISKISVRSCACACKFTKVSALVLGLKYGQTGGTNLIQPYWWIMGIWIIKTIFINTCLHNIW